MKICEGPGCARVLASASGRGGRPRRFCSEACRSKHRRLMSRIDRNTDRREVRLEDAAERRYEVRSAAYTVASAARRLAAELDAEATRPDWEQPAWHGAPRARQPWQPAGRYTTAALDVLDEAHRLVAAAVAADRAAGCDWALIGAALGVSADTASRRYRTTATGAPADDRSAR